MKHKAIIVQNLLYKGCEVHFKCKYCGICIPRHCYTLEQFEKLDCKGEKNG